MSISKQYTGELKKKTNYSATWLPTITVQPGDIGTISNYQFVHVTSLSKLGIPFVIVKGQPTMDLDYSSDGAVSILVKASGDAPLVGSSFTQGQAGISFRFTREKAVVFMLSGGRSDRIDDRNTLGKQVVSKYRNDTWDESWVVVTEAVSAELATILISQTSNAQIDLVAQGNLNAGETKLANINANFQVINESNIETKIIASKGVTPLFTAAGIHRSLIWEKVDFRDELARPGDFELPAPPKVETSFEELDYSYFDV